MDKKNSKVPASHRVPSAFRCHDPPSEMECLIVKVAYFGTCVGNTPTLLILLPNVEVAVAQDSSKGEHMDAKVCISC